MMSLSLSIYIYMYKYTHICKPAFCRERPLRETSRDIGVGRPSFTRPFSYLNTMLTLLFWWPYLLNAPCLIGPHLHVCFVVSGITTLCYIVHNFWRRPVLDKKYQTSDHPWFLFEMETLESQVRTCREFTKGGLVKGALAMRHVFKLHIQSGT